MGSRDVMVLHQCDCISPRVTCNVEGMATSSRDRVRTYRERLRRQGLRPIQIWVPDVTSPEFAAEAHRQSALAAASPHADDDQAFADAMQAPAWDDAAWDEE